MESFCAFLKTREKKNEKKRRGRQIHTTIGFAIDRGGVGAGFVSSLAARVRGVYARHEQTRPHKLCFMVCAVDLKHPRCGVCAVRKVWCKGKAHPSYLFTLIPLWRPNPPLPTPKPRVASAKAAIPRRTSADLDAIAFSAGGSFRGGVPAAVGSERSGS